MTDYVTIQNVFNCLTQYLFIFRVCCNNSKTKIEQRILLYLFAGGQFCEMNMYQHVNKSNKLV